MTDNPRFHWSEDDIEFISEKEYTRSEKEILLGERTKLFNEYVNALSEQVYSGEITLGEFQEMMKRSVREFHTGAAAIAKGGFENMGPRDWGRLGTPLREQYKWLQGFIDYIDQNRDTISLKYIQNRARLYGQGAIKTAVLIETPFYIYDLLPWIPKDGQSECLNKCHCRWVSELQSVEGNWRVYKFTWRLGQAEHCGTCVGRDGHIEILRIPSDVEVPDQIGGY